MSGIATSVQITDRLSPAFQTMTKSINICLGTFAQMQAAVGEGVNTAAIQEAQVAMHELTEAAAGIDRELDEAAQAQRNYNAAVGAGHSAVDGLLGKIKAMVGAYTGMKTVQGIIGLSDTMAQTTARLNLMNDGLQTTAELNRMIYQSAQNSRGAYLDTAAVVSRMGIMAKDAFRSNAELVQFSELMNKNFKIGGASAQEQSAAMYQLSQAMASGRLQGDEYRSIIENAPLLASSIEDYMVNVQHAKGSMKDWAKDGILTSEVIKAAMFNASDEINARFAELPITWGEVANSMKNQAIVAFQPVLQQISNLAANPNTQIVFNGIVNGIANIAAVAGPALSLMVDGAGLIVENWDMVRPVVLGVAGAVGGYTAAVAVHNVAQGIANTLKAASVINTVAHGAAITAEMTATTGMTAAQLSFNAALLGCPLTWVAVGVITVVSLLYAGVAAYNKFANASVSATGIIGGTFAVLAAHIANTFLIPTWNGFASIANFIGNVFNNPVAAVLVLFCDMAQTVIRYILNMANVIETVINKIPGVEVNITSGLDGFYNQLEVDSQRVKDASEWKEYVAKKDYIDYSGAAVSGYNWGKGVADGVSETFSRKKGIDSYGLDTIGSYTGLNTANNTAATAANTGKMADSIELSAEDLKYLRDIAERDIIDRTVFRDIKVELGGVTNQVNQMEDLDGIAEYLGEKIKEEMLISEEGVH